METEHDDDHLRPRPTAPGDPDPLWAQLEEARQVRRAIHDRLFEATQDFRTALADRPRDPRGLAIAYGHMHALEMQWAELDERVWRLRGEVEARWRQDDAA